MTTLLERLTASFDRLLDDYSALRILLGQAEPPEDAVIDEIGGWPVVLEVTRAWIERHPVRWRVFCDHYLQVRWGHRSLSGPLSPRIAKKYNISLSTVGRIGRGFPRQLAAAVIDYISE
jgi:hypothetical protein